MNKKRLHLALAACGLCLSLSASASSWLIQNVRVFDGEKIQLNRNVLIADGKIADPDFKGKVAADTRLVDGKGRTLLPGLIDAHVHAYQYPDLPLLFGVTTQIDMFTGVENMQNVNAKMQRGENGRQADMFSAGTLATAPGGHGTEYGMLIPTLEKPEQAQDWVDARIAEGSHFIKIVMEPGGEWRHFNSLDTATVQALITAAHQRNKLAVVHISTLQDARSALESGADGLVHLFVAKAINPSELEQLVMLAKHRHAFIIPTFSVLESIAGLKSGDILSDRHFTALLNKPQLQALNASYGSKPNPDLLIAPKAVTAALSAAQVRLLAGTDAGNAGTQYGASLHHELAALVQAGLTPLAALTAATSAPADAFQLKDRGRIAKDYKADLLLVEGAPDQDIQATRRIVEIWKDGESVTDLREKKRELVASENQPKKQGLHLPADGRISLFSQEKLASPFGLGWGPSNDGFMGGKSSTELTLSGAAPNGQAAVSVHAQVKPGFAYPWSGVAFMPGKQVMEAVDLSMANTLKFRVKGDGKRYQVAITVQGSYVPIMVGFTASEEWQ